MQPPRNRLKKIIFPNRWLPSYTLLCALALTGRRYVEVSKVLTLVNMWERKTRAPRYVCTSRKKKAFNTLIFNSIPDKVATSSLNVLRTLLKIGFVLCHPEVLHLAEPNLTWSLCLKPLLNCFLFLRATVYTGESERTPECVPNCDKPYDSARKLEKRNKKPHLNAHHKKHFAVLKRFAKLSSQRRV